MSTSPPAAAARPSAASVVARGLLGGAILGFGRLAVLYAAHLDLPSRALRIGELSGAGESVAYLLGLAVLLAGFVGRAGATGRSVAFLATLALLLGWPLTELLLEPVPAALGAVASAAAAVVLVPSKSSEARSLGPLAIAIGAAASLAAAVAGPLAAGMLEGSFPALEGERTVLSLLAKDVRREVVSENREHPVQVSTFVANYLTSFDGGNLPVLEMTPPAEVHVDVPAIEGGVLRLAAGLAADSYVSSTRTEVLLEADFGGMIERAKLTTYEKANGKRRTWKRAEIPIDQGGTLVLRTDFDGPPEEAPRAGFGLLEIVVPVEGRRTLASKEEPNVVLVLIDTLRADRLGTYGNERPASPALDALADRGTTFETAYSATSWTWPSTTSVLTSLTPPEHGVVDATSCYLSDGIASVAEVFQDAGFTTAAFAGNPLISADKNFDKGFESFTGYRWDPASVVLADAEAWLRDAADYRFFLYVHLTDPHAPYEPLPEFEDAFAIDPPPHYSEPGHKALVTKLRNSELTDSSELEQNSEYLSSLYDGEVATADLALEEFFGVLSELGLDERTVIAVTSDHGEEFLDHGMMGHGRQVHRESVHVPLILAGPGVPVARRIETPVENRFLAPTLLALAGVPPRANLAGRPNLLDEGDLLATAREPIFFTTELGWWPGHGVRTLAAVRDGDLLLIWSAGVAGEAVALREDSPLKIQDGPELQVLFDLASDPDAGQDLAPRRPEDVQRLRQAIQEWLEAGAAVRPTVFDGGEEVRDMLLGLGYIDEE